MTEYPYERGAPFTTRFVYAYSDASAPDYIERFSAARAHARRDLELPEAAASAVERRPPPADLDRRIQRFEVTGKVYSAYNNNGRGTLAAAADRIDDYVDFAEWVSSAYRSSGELPYLNALIKVLDVICAERARIGTAELAGRVCRLLDAESQHVANIAGRTA